MAWAPPIDVTMSGPDDVGDVNGDGRDDVVSPDYGGTSLRISNPNGTFMHRLTFPHVYGARFVDINGDGLMDLAGLTIPKVTCSYVELRMILNQGAACPGGLPTFTYASVNMTFPGCLNGSSSFAIGNHEVWLTDGHSPVIWTFEIAPAAVVGGLPTVGVAAPLSPIPTGYLGRMQACDLDGDPWTDLAVVSRPWLLSQTGTVHVYRGSPYGLVPNAGFPTMPVAGGFLLGAADLDGDGRDELMGTVNEPGVSGLGVLWNLGPSPAGGVALDPRSLWVGTSRNAVFGDLEGDGDVDVVVNDEGASIVRFLLNDGTGHFTQSPTTMPLLPLGHVWSGDLDGNGRVDVLQRGFSNDARIYLNTTAALQEPRPGYGVGATLSTTLPSGPGWTGPASGPVGAIKQAQWFQPGATVRVLNPGGLDPASMVVLGLEVFPTGCPPTPYAPNVWVSAGPSTTFEFGTLSNSGLPYTFPLVIPAAQPGVIEHMSIMIQAAVLEPAWPGTPPVLTPAHEIQF